MAGDTSSGVTIRRGKFLSCNKLSPQKHASKWVLDGKCAVLTANGSPDMKKPCVQGCCHASILEVLHTSADTSLRYASTLCLSTQLPEPPPAASDHCRQCNKLSQQRMRKHQTLAALGAGPSNRVSKPEALCGSRSTNSGHLTAQNTHHLCCRRLSTEQPMVKRSRCVAISVHGRSSVLQSTA